MYPVLTPTPKIVTKRNRASTYIIPTESHSKALTKDSDDATVTASNLSADLRGWSDDETSATEPLTDESDSDSDVDRIPITIPSMILPWGGRDPSKTTRKWRNRVATREQKRIEKQNRKFKSRSTL